MFSENRAVYEITESNVAFSQQQKSRECAIMLHSAFAAIFLLFAKCF